MAEYSVINNYLCVSVGECTCGAGESLAHPHATGCGWEPISKVETLLAEVARGANRVTWDKVRDYEQIQRINELLQKYGISYPQGAAGVDDLVAFSKRHRRQAEIARGIIQFLRNKGFTDDANRYDTEMDDA